MKLEDQVVNLELSKRLKELGIKQDSLFYWHNIDSIPSVICNHWYPERSGDFFVSSFTASEILEILPDYLDDAGCLKIEKHDVNGEGITYFIEYGYGYYDHQDKNLSNALAKILIHLIENKLIEV